MLVVNERDIQGAEQCVLEWIRTWNGQYVIVGLAVSGYPIPDDDTRDATRQTDVVVITPRAVVVIEAQNTDAESVPLRDDDPLDLSRLVRGQHPDAFVDRLVVAVPPGEAAVTTERESRKSGGTVVGSSTELRAWFLRTANRKLIWTAEQAYELLGELGLSHVVTVEELVAEGFPSQTGRPKRSASKVLVPAYASAAVGAAALPNDARMSSERSAAYPPWLPTEIDEAPPENEALSRPEIEQHALVSAPPQAESQSLDHPDAMQAQSDAQLSSAFTDSWSSWIESDESLDEPAPRRGLDRRGRSHREPRLRNWLPKPISPILVATAAARNQPPASVAQAKGPQRSTETGSLPDIEPQPVSPKQTQPPVIVEAQPVSAQAPPLSSAFEAQPPTKAQPRPVRLSQPGNAPAARPHRASAPRLAAAVRRCFVAVAATGMKLIAGLPQLLATAVVVGAIIATSWLLISEGMHPKPAVVEPRPESSTEPAGQLKLPATSEPPAARCFPFQQQC
ncbi:hypothetical protein ACIBG0_03755 [Nocardia sp. NPDC050630]|uniref:hypothetical protein n=1 Tax=Nocardia sp. NPDC050630 TaxID=3364321 RepID=UPI0037B36D7F